MRTKKFLNALRAIIATMLFVVLGAFAVACGDDKPKTWAESGVYVCYDTDEETALTLSGGKKFVYVVGEESKTGTYKLTDLSLVLTFSDKTTMTAAYSETAVKMAVDGVDQMFYKVINYNVTYDSQGGSEVAGITTVNGKTIEKPANPTRSGYEFIGWYEESACKTPFLFDTKRITSNKTLYARWAVSDPDAAEFSVSFDVNYTGGKTYETVSTIDGKLYDVNVPAPVRNGYTFQGWAISLYDDGAKPSYMFKDAMTFAENTTLFAVWQQNDTGKLDTPVVSVEAGAITWNAVTGVSSYKVEVIGPDGFSPISATTGATTYNVAFNDAPLGDYTVQVTAVASNTDKNSEAGVRTYLNKALSRVSHFAVKDGKVSFNAVANVTNYFITVDCGDINHNHTDVDLGTATEYDFSGCLMQKGGIKFTVTSAAEGYSSVTSRTFAYVADLGEVKDLAVDEGTGKLTWSAVENADYYVVSILCGKAGHSHGEEVKVTGTEYSLKECSNADGGIVVNVYAVGEGYNASAVAKITYNKTALATPAVVSIDGTTMTWSAVNGATGYTVKVGDKTFTSATNSVDLSAQQIEWVKENNYKIALQATGANGAASLWSDELDVRYLAMATSISYDKGTLSWNHVVGATAYEVRVNESETTTMVEDGKNYAEITFTKSGDNKLEVRFYEGTTASAWVATTVKAFAVEFDTKVADTTFATQYKATGDPTDSFDGSSLQKLGYTFYGWYKTDKVGAGNAPLYTDAFFKGTADTKLYADYTPNTYTLTYDYQGGTGMATSAKVVFDKAYTLVVPTIADATKSFGGWYSAPGGTGLQYTDGNGESVNNWTLAEDATIYAFWKLETLEFEKMKLPGDTEYSFSVSQGARINLVNEITIPQTYMGLPVKRIAPNAFKDCAKLLKVNLPNTIVEIHTKPSSFAGCVNLREINVTEVEGNRMIRYWSKDGVLFDNGRLDEQPEDLSQCEASVAAFPMGYPAKKYTVPAGVAEIPYESFAACQLEEIVISKTVSLIETDAFYNCVSLKSVKFEEPAAGEEVVGLTIKKRAFRGCTALETVELPARLAEIDLSKYYTDGNYSSSMPSYEIVTTSYSSSDPNASGYIGDVFAGCTKLEKITVQEGGTNYSSDQYGIIYNADKTEIVYVPREFAGPNGDGKYTIPSGVTTIGNGAFVYSLGITELTIPSYVTTIGEYAFYYAYNIEKLTFGGKGFAEVSIGRYAFRSAYDIKEIVFEEGSKVTSIGEGAFYSMSYLSSVTIPATVRSIGNHAFASWCLTKVTFEETTAAGASLEFGDGVFYNSRITEITLPAQVTDLGGMLAGMNSLRAVYVSENSNTYYADKEGILFDKDQTEILYYPSAKTGNYTLPDTVTTIGAGVFANNRNITSFTIGKNVTTIGDNAFYQCSKLETVTFEDGGTEDLTIGKYAFRYCTAIKEIVLPKRCTTIGNYAFSNMSNMTRIVLNEGLTQIPNYCLYYNSKLTEVVIPSTVETIGYYGVGYNSKLTKITFAKNAEGKTAVREIGAYAFYYNNLLETITIPASVEVIRNYAFYASSTTGRLSTVTFEENSKLKEIYPYAFYYAKKLKTITIPKSVEYIHPYAFYYSGLETITFEQGGTEDLYIGAYLEYYSSPTSSSKTRSYGYAFAYTNLQRVDFPARVKELGRYTFYYNKVLKTVTFDTEKDGENNVIPSRLDQIGEYCFYGCYEFEAIKIPKSVKNLTPIDGGSSSYRWDRQAIGRYAFGYCYALGNVEFELGGKGPLSLGRGAFYHNDALEVLNLPARLASYTDFTGAVNNAFGAVNEDGELYRFYCENLKELNVVDVANATEDNMYLSSDGIIYDKEMKQLVVCPMGREKEVVIENTTEIVKAKAFEYCSKITSVKVEEGAAADVEMTIDTNAFKDCTSLANVQLPDYVTVLNPNAFKNCVALTSIELPSGLKEFDATVFSGCTGLTSVTISDNNLYKAQDGILFSPDMTTLYYYPLSKTETTYTVPSSVKTIYQYAFYNNQTLESIVLPRGLQSIGESAFRNCQDLATVNIPNTVVELGDYAFYNCAKLATVTFETGNDTNPLEIGNKALVHTSNFASSKAVTNGYTFGYCYSLTNVQLPKRTTSIADNTFAYCRGLKTINIPANVEALGRGAFRYCERLEAVDIEAGCKITNIAYKLFEYCYSLKEFTVPASVIEFDVLPGKKDSYAFYYCENLKNVTFEEGCGIEVLYKYTFGYCYKLEAIEFPAAFKEIADASSSYAPFYRCESLKSITFAGDQVERFGNYAFAYCFGLESIDIPATVTEFGYNVFYNCILLDNVTIPETVTDIGYGLFSNCKSLKNVTLPDTMDTIYDSMFNGCESLTEFEITENITTIESYAFAGAGFKTFTVPEWITELYYGLFSGCPNLEEVVLHDGITYIEDEVFAYNPVLKKVLIPDSVEYFGYYMFSDCPMLETVKLPANDQVTILPDGTFYNCKSLKTVEIPENFTLIEYYAMQGAGIESLVIPDTVTEIQEYAFEGCTDLETVVLPSGLTYIAYNLFDGCTSLKNVTFSDSGLLTEIQEYAFMGCTSLTKLDLPESITTIGPNAFANSGLTEFYLSGNVADIGDNAFAGCKDLTKFEVDEVNGNFEIIDDILMNEAGTEIYLVLPEKTGKFVVSEDYTLHPGAFAISRVSEVELPADMLEIPNYMFEGAKYLQKVVLPEGLMTIGNYAFSETGLTSIHIPASVTVIGIGAFDATTDLETVTFAEGNLPLSFKSYAFRNSGLTSITIPYRVRKADSSDSIYYAIGTYAFQNCANLKTLVFEENPAEGAVEGALVIGQYAFQNCVSLERVDFPSVLGNLPTSTSYYGLGAYVFNGCTSLKAVTFKPTEGYPITIGNYAFGGCTSLSEFEIPSTAIYLGGYALAETKITEATIPESVADFYYVSTYVYENGISKTTYYNRLFYNCTELKTVTIKAKLDASTQRLAYMFEGCTALETVDIQDGTTTLGEKMFVGCTSLKTVNIPASVTLTDRYVFEGLTSATTVNIDKTELETYQWTVFWNHNTDANIVYKN